MNDKKYTLLQLSCDKNFKFLIANNVCFVLVAMVVAVVVLRSGSIL